MTVVMSEMRVLESGLPPAGGLGSPPKMPVTLRAAGGGGGGGWRAVQAGMASLGSCEAVAGMPVLLQRMHGRRKQQPAGSRAALQLHGPGASTAGLVLVSPSPAHEGGLAAAGVGGQADHHHLRPGGGAGQ